MPARRRLSATARTALRCVARTRLASFRFPPRPGVAMQTRSFPQPSVPQSAVQRLRASPARARQTVHRVTASCDPAPAALDR